MLIAKIIYRLISLSRRCVGKTDRCVVTGSGLTYELDLAQGIDLSISLFGTFEPGIHQALRRTVQFGANVIDIGANIVTHTRYLAELA
jgi:hypothetical protein